MKHSFFILLTSALMLIATASCTTFAEDFDFGTEVIQIEKSLVSYYDSNNNHWYCREALIYVNSKAEKVMFPVDYEGEIISGTRVEWNCHTIFAYYVNGKKIYIDWNASNLNK